jgi:GTP-binding protein
VEPFPTDGSTPADNYRAIRRELELYDPNLANKQELVAMTKCELTESDRVVAELSAEIGSAVLPISAVTGQGLAPLVNRIVHALRELPAEETT